MKYNLGTFRLYNEKRRKNKKQKTKNKNKNKKQETRNKKQKTKNKKQKTKNKKQKTKKQKNKKETYVGRESNPAQLIGRRVCSPLYHQCRQIVWYYLSKFKLVLEI